MPQSKALDPKRRGELRMMRSAGVPIKDCASYFGISEATAYRELAEMRRLMGPEKVRGREQYARWHLIARNLQLTEK